jgi:hypothetical protein
MQAWLSKNEEARVTDQLVLDERLKALEVNQSQLMETLGTLGMSDYQAMSR